MREDGLRVDRVLLVTDTNYIPSGLGPAESPFETITETIPGGLGTTSISYGYDALYRLTDAAYTGAITATFAYDYDPVGNMTAFTETVDAQTTSVTRTFDGANRLEYAVDASGTTTYTYDANGNLVELLPPGATVANPVGGPRYEYDQRNLMVSHEANPDGTAWVLQAEYVYDGTNDRLRQVDYTGATPVTTTYTNDIFGLTQVLVADDGTDQVYNLFGLDLISQDSVAEVRTLLVDGLGSVRLEMVGGVVETVTTYSPYGEVLEQAGTSGTVYGFTGEQEDEATGLLYLRARYYSPQLKVFHSRDPWEGTGLSPATLNYYAYTQSNPINLTDPTGKTAWPEKNIVAIQALKPSIIASATRHNNFTRSNLTDNAFAALMAAHLNRESRFGALTPRLPGDIAGDLAAQLLHADTSIGIANIRPSVGVEILFGIIPGVPGCYYYEIHGSQWLELWNTYPDSPYFYPFGNTKADYFQSLLVSELLDDKLNIEYLAANIERGVDRAKFLKIEPSVFNLGNWLWRGVQDPQIIQDAMDRGEDLYRHGAALVEDMPKAFDVLELPFSYYNAYNLDEAKFVTP